MTKQEALAKGFVYEGRCGIVPVYLTDVNAFGTKQPGLTAQKPWQEPLLDVQEALNTICCAVINFFRPGTAEGVAILFGDRLDGTKRTEQELD